MEKTLNCYKGEVVVVPFPFSDLSTTKKRPAVVLVTTKGEDIILAQITSQLSFSEFSINIKKEDFATGKLPVASYIKTNKLFSADKRIIIKKVGKLKQSKIKEIELSLVNLFTR